MLEDDDWKGRLIDGRYMVESVLGKGGMGLVLRARHKFTGVEVAVKILRPELQLDTEVQMRFLGEARAPNAIGHPGIVQVVDAGKAPDGLLYLVMELLHGRALREPLSRGELTHPELRRIMLELFDALAAAHVRGFVHRDLKPENVFLAGQAATVKLLDFGIAKVLDSGLARVRTALGVTLGTPAYMAPEQINDASGVDARADLWAAGVMIYEMLCGHLPYSGDTTGAFFLAIATKEPTPIRAYLPSAPPALDAFFSRALARELFKRFSSAQEMAQAFAALPLGFAAPGMVVQGSAATVATGAAMSAPMTPAARSAIGFDATHTPQHAPAPAPHSMYAPPAMPDPAVAMSYPAPPQVPVAVTPHPSHASVNPHPPSTPPHMSQPAASASAHAAALPGASTTQVTNPPPRSRAGLILGVVGVLALIGAIAVVALGRGGGGNKPVAKQGSAVPIDAAVVAVVTVDAGVADAAVVAQAIDAAVLLDAAPRIPRDPGIKPVHRDAGVEIDAGATKPAPPKNRCAAQGTASCRSAMNCQRGCEDDDHNCRCLCAATAHPSHQQAITAYATCAKSCGFGKVCMAMDCKRVVAACLKR